MFYTLKSKMMLTFSLLLVVPFLIMVFIFTEQSKKSVEQVALTVSAQTLDQYAEYLEMLGRQVEDIAFQVLGNKEVQKWIVTRDAASGLDVGERTRQEMLLLNARVKDVLAQTVLSQSNVASISLYDRTGFVIGTDSVYEHVKYEVTDWYAYVKQNGPGWLNVHTDPYQPYALQRNSINSLLFPLVNLETLSIQGAIKLNVSSSLIQAPLSRMQYNEWNSISLVNSKGDPVVPPSETEPFQTGGNALLRNQILQSNASSGFFKEHAEGTVRYWFFRKVKPLDWVIVGIISEEELFRDIRQTSRTMLWIGVGLLLLTIGAALWISTGMARPLSKLSSAMRLLEKGDFKIAEKLDASVKGEAGYLLKVFKNMANRLNELVHNEFILKLRKQDAEYKALLMQVNPHFLYNTLEIIAGLAGQKKTEQLLDVTESLGQMLRHSLKLDTDIVKLSDEFQQLQYYAAIMKARFEDNIEFEWHMEPALSNVDMIKFILQPIVENAVKYSRGVSPARIRISAVKENHHLVLAVEDNGEGMSEDMINEIMQQVKSQDALQVLGGPARRIGLRNVLARCRLYYGDRFRFEMISEENKGTKIVLKIPIGGGVTDVQSAARGR